MASLRFQTGRATYHKHSAAAAAAALAASRTGVCTTLTLTHGDGVCLLCHLVLRFSHWVCFFFLVCRLFLLLGQLSADCLFAWERIEADDGCGQNFSVGRWTNGWMVGRSSHVRTLKMRNPFLTTSPCLLISER
ncbi:hypothetical protein BC567DRAFT_34638 [Phyllosticta citribraziliensis]